ncbi:MAG: YqgE/AlgH family protein [Bacteroidetes bacterium]|nr:MAG: YqgE/AlgH family protein [Bacteroidota bacterium]
MYLTNSIHQGCVLQSTDAMDEAIFTNSQIILAKCVEDDCIGFLYNKPTGKYLHQLVEFQHFPAIPLWQGGPVSTDYLYVIHTHPEHFPGAEPIVNSFYLGGSVQHLFQAIQSKKINPHHLHCFLGYCGWDKEQLEQEVQDGYWTVSTTTIHHLLTT